MSERDLEIIKDYLDTLHNNFKLAQTQIDKINIKPEWHVKELNDHKSFSQILLTTSENIVLFLKYIDEINKK